MSRLRMTPSNSDLGFLGTYQERLFYEHEGMPLKTFAARIWKHRRAHLKPAIGVTRQRNRKMQPELLACMQRELIHCGGIGARADDEQRRR